jgi:hypothetical protein
MERRRVGPQRVPAFSHFFFMTVILERLHEKGRHVVEILAAEKFLPVKTYMLQTSYPVPP